MTAAGGQGGPAQKAVQSSESDDTISEDEDTDTTYLRAIEEHEEQRNGSSHISPASSRASAAPALRGALVPKVPKLELSVLSSGERDKTSGPAAAQSAGAGGKGMRLAPDQSNATVKDTAKDLAKDMTKDTRSKEPGRQGELTEERRLVAAEDRHSPGSGSLAASSRPAPEAHIDRVRARAAPAPTAAAGTSPPPPRSACTECAHVLACPQRLSERVLSLSVLRA